VFESFGAGFEEEK